MPGPPVQQQFNFTTPDKQGSQVAAAAAHTSIVNVPAEAYAAVDKIINPEIIFLNRMGRLLISGVLVKDNTGIGDSISPLAGYNVVGIGEDIDPDKPDYTKKGVRRNTLVRYEGYNVIVNNYLFLISEVISTTEFDVREINLKKVCIDGVWAIVCQIVTNWEDWDFKDPSEIMPLGIAMWFNLYSVARRSTGSKMLDFYTSLFKALGRHAPDEEMRNDKMMFWKSHATPSR